MIDVVTRYLPSAEDGTLDEKLLAATILKDKEKGLIPFLVSKCLRVEIILVTKSN